jgi:hypothetical protein
MGMPDAYVIPPDENEAAWTVRWTLGTGWYTEYFYSAVQADEYVEFIRGF